MEFVTKCIRIFLYRLYIVSVFDCQGFVVQIEGRDKVISCPTKINRAIIFSCYFVVVIVHTYMLQL